MTTDIQAFLQSLDRQIQAKHLLNHDFYQAWSRGELTIPCLQDYAKNYGHHVRAFPTYVSFAHANTYRLTNTEEIGARKVLLKNLMEEEAGSPNHPELWKMFALALGVTEEEFDHHQPNAEIKHLVGLFREICAKDDTAAAVAALYAYESQIPEICISKIDGLKKHYGMKDPSNWTYFSVHIHADQEHAAEERTLLGSLVHGDHFATIPLVVNGVLDALWNFLSGLCHRYDIRCSV